MRLPVRVSPSQTAAVYDRIAEHWDHPGFDHSNGMAQHPRALTFASTDGSALDVGCGPNGRIVSLLLQHGFEVTALDLSAEMLRRARQHNPAATFHQVDICTWAIPRPYDFIALGNAALGFETPPDVHSNLPLFRQAIARGPDAVLAQHRASTERDNMPSEGETNRMGYNLLGAGRVAHAIALFRLNTLLHPDSANAHDSLGEAYLANGQNALALASYRRVLELTPGHPAATRAIRLIEGGPGHE